jgi:hypothetical protein
MTMTAAADLTLLVLAAASTIRAHMTSVLVFHFIVGFSE